MGADGRGAPAGAQGGGGRETAVVCRDLVVRYGDRTAVDRVSLHADRGEVLCVLGPNGAGKTSTVECLEGYRRPAAGSASVLGLDPWRDHRVLVGRIGVMLQRGGLYPMLGPRRALRLFASYYSDPEDPEELLEVVRLRDVARTPWRHLSGGEQARLSLALALVGRPAVVFLDEPTAGVDPEGRLAVRELIGGLRARGVCVILTTHELAEAERLGDRIVILHRGAVVAEGTTAALAAAAGRSQAGGAATVGAGGPDARGSARDGESEEVSFGAAPGLDVGALGAAAGARVVEEAPGRYRLTAPPGAPAAGLAAAVATWLAERGLALHELRVGRSLEEAYLAIVGAAAQGEGDGGGGGHSDPAGGAGRGRRRSSPPGRSRRARVRRDRRGLPEGRPQ